ncbi:MAG: helix-turn-helix domain-containing protein [Clostridia bacterium]|nr:helix-turn-helix domain-containing protein [Clostridia bacterium]
MDKIVSEFKKLTEAAGFRAGIADRNGKVIYCPEDMGLGAGDVISGSAYIAVDAEGNGAGDFILFALPENDKRADDLTLCALKLVRNGLFGEAGRGLSVSGLFTDALEDRTGGAGKKLELVMSEAGDGHEYRLLTACCGTGADSTKEGATTDQISQVEEVASELFPEDQGFLTGIFRRGGNAYVGALLRIRRNGGEDVTSAADYALQFVDTASAETMVDVKVAVSSGFTSLDRLGEMARQTLSTLKLGEKFGIRDRCLIYENLGLERLVSSISEEDRLEYLRAVLGGQQWTDRSMQELLNTVSVFLQCNQNSSVTAKRMDVHRNTVNNRIEKFGKLTGLDCTSFRDGVRVRLALLIIRYMGQGDPADSPVD